MWLILYLLAVPALALQAADVLAQPGARELVVPLGLVAAWRFGSGAVQLGRALYYRGVLFPRWRRAADQLGDAGAASQVYILIATYRIRAETTARVYQAAIAEAVRYGRPATVVAAIVELGDQRLIKRVFQQMRPPAEIRLAFVRRPATGRRHQVARSLRAISRMRPPADAAVVLMDGATLLTPGSLARSLPFLRLMPDVDAIATDEACIVANPIMQAWHSLCLAQRHQMMSSMAPSRRPLAVGGRMSIHRAEVATDPGFIDLLENDRLDHGRARFALLAGEDNAVWCGLPRQGRRMLYLPDVSVGTIEPGPAKGLLPTTAGLMLDRFGSALPGSPRAIALGPRRIGVFAWWCLIDRRLSMWVPLLGAVVALLFALGKSVLFLYAYLLWVAATRLIQALLLLTARPTISGLYPLLIYFGQVHGALVKACALLRVDRQRRTRHDIALEARLAPWQARRQNLASAYLHVLAIGTLVAAAALGTRLLDLPPLL